MLRDFKASASSKYVLPNSISSSILIVMRIADYELTLKSMIDDISSEKAENTHMQPP
jgi:hypothetical protein